MPDPVETKRDLIFVSSSFRDLDKMSAGKWMFGGSSKGDLTESPRAKATGNRELPVGYDQGGLNIGDSDASGNSARRKASASAYRASLDADKVRVG